MGLQQENPRKNDDFVKIIKKSTFFLKNRFTVDNFWKFFKKCPKITANLNLLKKAFVYWKNSISKNGT